MVVDYAIAVNPNFAKSYYFRGLAKFKMNELDEAIRDFNKVLTLKINYTDAFFYRGKAKYDAGDIKNGCMDYQKAKELGSRKVNAKIQKQCEKVVFW